MCLERYPEALEDLEVGGQADTIQTTAALRSARILKKSRGNLRSLSVTQTTVKDHRLTLVGKIHKKQE